MTICTEDWFSDLVAKRQKLRETDQVYIVAIFDKKNHHLGMIDIATLARDQMDWGEIGYFVHNNFWRRGYAFEALSAILEVAKDELNFHRIEAHVNVDNVLSAALLKKLGFKFEIIRKNFIFEDNYWIDQKVFYKNLF